MSLDAPIVLLVTGFIIGVMNAVAGGGMLLGFPVMLAAGIPPMVANATGNIVVMPGQISAAYGYRSYLKKLRWYYLLLLVPCLIGAAIGATILRNTAAADFTRLVPGLILFAVVLFAFQPLLHFHVHRHVKNKTQKILPLVLVAIAFLPMAIYGGYFGAGFGFIMLAFLGFTSLHDVHLMNALKSLAGVCISVVALLFLFSTGLIDWGHGLIMAFGNLLGGYYGAVGAQKVSTHAIRIGVIAIGLSAALYLGLRNY